jgi:hypothetical protein
MSKLIKIELSASDMLGFLIFLSAAKERLNSNFSEDPIRVSFIIELTKRIENQFVNQCSLADINFAKKEYEERFH